MTRRRWSRNLVAAACAGAAALPLLAGAAQAAQPATRADAPIMAPTVFAEPPTMPGGTTATNPDDLTQLGDLIYVSFQNNAGKDGTPAGSFSTIAAYHADTGALATTYQLPGRCDGLTADPTHHRLLASVNEDNNSSLFVIHPGQSAPQHYTYSPNPAETGSDGTNGGTDAISVAPGGTVYVAHSNPDVNLPAPNNTAAVYTLTLAGDTATLTPLFGVNDTAKVIDPAPGASTSAPLALTDPDSNRFLSRNGGTLVQDAQADSKLVLATHLHAAKPTLRQLLLSNAAPTSSGQAATPQLDDLTRVAGPGRLLVVDQKGDAIYSLHTTTARPGTVFVSQPAPGAGDLPNDPALGVVDLRTGVVTHLNTHFASPKGLLFIPDDQDLSDGLLNAQDAVDTTSHLGLPPGFGF
ncbi:MAG: hypothetical protein WAN20_12220 [Pseudonocardiaceae bacterium]